MEDGAQIRTTPHCVLSFHAYQDETPPDAWKDFQESPVKKVLARFNEGTEMVMSPPWNRQWTNERFRLVDKSVATHVSFLARIDQSSLASVLKQSGHNGIYLNPLLSAEEQPSVDTRIIWISQVRSEAVQQSVLVAEQLGIARSLKRGYGLRVPVDSFDALFGKLRPLAEKPEFHGGSLLFRLQPLPSGMLAADVRKMLGEFQWKAAPVKALGANAWMISSAVQPPQQFFRVNGDYVLANEIPRKVKGGRPNAFIAAGHRAPSQGAVDPLTLHDPWAASRNGSRGSAHTVVAPPDNAKVDRLDQDVAYLQNAVKEMQSKQDHMQKDMHGFQNQVKAEINTLSATFQSTLEGVMQKQETRLIGEMKGLLGGRKRSAGQSGVAGSDMET